jgi:hypothetical protein
MDVDPDLDRLARRQHSLLACWQLAAAGWSPSVVWRAVDAGTLFTIRRGVFRTAGALETQWQAWMAAVLATRNESMLSHLSVLAAYGFVRFPRPEGIDLVRVGPQARMPGVTSHRTLWLPDHDRTRRNFVPCTTPERAFIDCCGELPEWLLDEAGDDALRRKLMTLPHLVRSFEQTPCSGRRKSVPMRIFLANESRATTPAAARGRSMCVASSGAAAIRSPSSSSGSMSRASRTTSTTSGRSPSTGSSSTALSATAGWSAFHRDRERLRRLTRAGLTIWPVTSQTTANEILAIAEIATRSFR